MDLSKMTRRDFHKSTTLGVTSLALSAGPPVRNVIGANDRIGIALIGAGGQGRFDFSSMIRTNQVDPIAAADVYTLPLVSDPPLGLSFIGRRGTDRALLALAGRLAPPLAS